MMKLKGKVGCYLLEAGKKITMILHPLSNPLSSSLSLLGLPEIFSSTSMEVMSV
jgi:hypothetical protein